MLPKLIYYKCLNPDYQRIFTLDDTTKPDRETYDHMVSNWATLGRIIPSFEAWSKNYRETHLEELQRSSRCKYSIQKRGVSSEQEIEDFFRLHPEYEQFP